MNRIKGPNMKRDLHNMEETYPNEYEAAYAVQNILNPEVHTPGPLLDLRGEPDRSLYVAHYLEDLTHLLVTKGILSGDEVYSLVNDINERLKKVE